MDKVFITVLKMSITSSYVILFVLTVRLLLKRCPKIFSYMLWGIVLFRLLCPVSFESKLSFIPNNSISDGSINISKPLINYIDYYSDDSPKNVYEEENVTGNIETNKINTSNNVENPINITSIASKVWIMAISIIIFYSSYLFIKLKKYLKSSRLIKENIYENNDIDTAFVLGIINPKIYIPNGLSEKEEEYILAHERIHIKRYDYIIKIVAYIALIIHCFNPLVWLSFILMSKDMEMSCDEAVVKSLGIEIKKQYSMSLLSFATEKRALSVTPIAFGEGNVKSRIKNILNYKMPRFWITLLSAVVVIILGVGLIFNPIKADDSLLDINKTLEEISKSSDVIIRKSGEGSYICPGSNFAKNIKKEIQGWSEHKVKSSYELSADIVVYINGDRDYKLSFYESEPNLVMITHEGKSKYYKSANLEQDTMKSMPYNTVLSIQTLINYYVPEEVAAVITGGKKTNKTSYDDRPRGVDYLELDVDVWKYYIYEENNKYYVERPYVDIYEIDKEVYEGAKKYFEEPVKYTSNISDDEFIEELVCETVKEQELGFTKEDISIVTPKILGIYEEENKLKVFTTVKIGNFSLSNNVVEEQSGAIFPIAITYVRNSVKSYSLEEYLEAMDGGQWEPSIKAFCTMPVSEKEIEGLANKILAYNMDYNDIIQLERERLIQYLKNNNLQGISLIDRGYNEPDKIIPLIESSNEVDVDVIIANYLESLTNKDLESLKEISTEEHGSGFSEEYIIGLLKDTPKSAKSFELIKEDKEWKVNEWAVY